MTYVKVYLYMVTVDSTNYLASIKKRLAKIADPVARARVASDEITAAGEVLAALARARSDAVNTARATMSAQAIATELGITRARVYQLIG